MMYIYTYKNNIHACPTIVGKPDRGGKAKKEKAYFWTLFHEMQLVFFSDLQTNHILPLNS